jgi:hypothetical protein
LPIRWACTLVLSAASLVGCALGAYLSEAIGRGATVVSPFIVGSLMASYQLPGVVWLMIGLVVVQIVVVWAWASSRATAGWRMSPRRRRDRIALPVYQL